MSDLACPARRPYGYGSPFMTCDRTDAHELHRGQGYQWRDGAPQGPLPRGCVPKWDGSKVVNPADAFDAAGWPARGE